MPIMEWLRDHRIPTTIFVAGSVIDSPYTDVGRTTLAMMEANPDLFEMASHGYHHPDMRTLTAAAIADELEATERTLAARGARTARPLFRPPSGYYDAEVLRVAGSLGYRYTVLWDLDPLDWKTVANGGPTADDIVAKVVGRAQGGSIVLLHLSGTQTLAALPGVVEGLRAKGLEPVTVGELLGSAAPALRPGELAFVSVAVATGWREPSSARAVDAPALAQPVGIRDWLGSLSRADQEGLIGRADTQMLLGDAVRVEALADGWAKVTVPAQPTPLDAHGYPVWVPARQLTAALPVKATTTATVTVPTTWLEDAGGDQRLEVSFGTRLPVMSAAEGRLEVSLPDGRRLWVSSSGVAIRATGAALAPTATSIIDTARQFLGTRYLWAGTSGYGFDCSGLVYSVYRLHGVDLPRDSGPQSTSGVAVARADLRPGDLVFFGSAGRVHHVAIYTGDGRILESPFVGGLVREVRLADRDGFIAARRVLP
ncbi:MAG TPA: NlpC/P60 family protein [Candidatus Limnocylindrales bacterium]